MNAKDDAADLSGDETLAEEPVGFARRVRDWLTTRRESELVAAWFDCGATKTEVTSAFNKACVRSLVGLSIGAIPTLNHLSAGDMKTALVGGVLTVAFLYISERKRRVLDHASSFINAEERLDRARGEEMFLRRGGKELAGAYRRKVKTEMDLWLLQKSAGIPTLLDRFLCVTPPPKPPLGLPCVGMNRRFLL